MLPDLCTLSRWLGFIATGRRVMLCALLADRRWFQIPVDALFWWFRGESFHCAWCAAAEPTH